MEDWEYEKFKGDEAVNEAGRHGWEAYSTVRYSSNSENVIYFCKRIKTSR